MMGKKDNAERTQMEIASLEDLVPGNHLVRKLDEAIDMRFIYEEVKDLYSDFGRESIDPVVLIKIAMIQYIFGIPSMRKTIREIEVNFAYRWYLGYGMHEEIPHFSTFGKNYSRRFKDTDLFRGKVDCTNACPKLQQMVFLIQKAYLLTALTSKPVPILINIIMRLSEKKRAVMRKNCRKKSKGIVRNTERSR